MSAPKFASARVRAKVPAGQVSDLGYTIEHQHDGHGWHWPTSEHRDGTVHERSVNWVGPVTDEQKRVYFALLAGKYEKPPFRNAPKAKKPEAPVKPTVVEVDGELVGDGALVQISA